MQLYRQDIDGWNNIQTSGIPLFKFSETQPTGYVLYDTIEQINTSLNYPKILVLNDIEYYCDFKYTRDRIKDKFTKWNDHTTQEKIIFCGLKIGSDDDRNNFIGLTNSKMLSIKYSYNATTIARGNRAKFLVSEVWSRLTDIDAKNVAHAGRDAFVSYLTFGFEGSIAGDPDGLYDFIYGIAGSRYAGIGIMDMVLEDQPIGSTKQEFCDYLTDIFLYGKRLDLPLAKALELI